MRGWFTRWFEDQVAWLTAHASSSTVAELMRTTSRSAVTIVGRVTAELAGKTDRLAGIRGSVSTKWPTVRDSATSSALWIVTRVGRCGPVSARTATLQAFFDKLGPDRAAQLTHVSADGAEWIHTVVREGAPQAKGPA